MNFIKDYCPLPLWPQLDLISNEVKGLIKVCTKNNSAVAQWLEFLTVYQDVASSSLVSTAFRTLVV
jgi:hypothetical protein